MKDVSEITNQVVTNHLAKLNQEYGMYYVNMLMFVAGVCIEELMNLHPEAAEDMVYAKVDQMNGEISVQEYGEAFRDSFQAMQTEHESSLN